MRTPSRASISARKRAIVQFGRSATGSSSSGVTTRNAVELFTGTGPGAMLAFSASTPPLPKSLRHSRTVSSRTPKRFSDPRTGPARQRQQHGTRPIRLPAIARPRKRHQGDPLFGARCNQRLSTHTAPIQIGANTES